MSEISSNTKRRLRSGNMAPRAIRVWGRSAPLAMLSPDGTPALDGEEWGEGEGEDGDVQAERFLADLCAGGWTARGEEPAPLPTDVAHTLRAAPPLLNLARCAAFRAACAAPGGAARDHLGESAAAEAALTDALRAILRI